MTLYAKRKTFDGLSESIGKTFGKAGLTPNQWTILSLLPTLIAVYFLTVNQFFFAALFFIIAASLDLVDGSVARMTGKVSKFGSYLDTMVDRYVEAFIIFGLLFAALPSFIIPISAWLFLYFMGSIFTTYAKSAAKEKNLTEKEIKGGLLERAERMLILFAGIILAGFNPIFLTYVIALLAILTNFSALQRACIAKKLSAG